MKIKGQNLDKSLLECYGIKFGIYDDLNRNVAEYSKGMRRKISILIVMLCEANIIIVEHDLTKFENVDNFIIMENGLVINADKNV